MVIERPHVLAIARVARMSISNRSLPGPHAQGGSAVAVVVVDDDGRVAAPAAPAPAHTQHSTLSGKLLIVDGDQ